MADTSKWGKTLDALKQSQQREQASVPVIPAQTRVGPVRVKPRSKSSDPAWKPYTLMLKKDTHTQAGILLKRLDTGEDMSDVAQRLFEEWLAKNS